MFKYLSLHILIISCFFCHSIYGQIFELLPKGPIHEAYLTRIIPAGTLEAIAIQPPAVIMELLPDKVFPQAEWIPGYWSWIPQRHDFIWVSGIWRRPPPGKFWINGLWRHFDEGWVWVTGFWSPHYGNDLKFLDKAPPEQKEDEVPEPPSSDLFWMPGYWSHSESNNQYIWLTGNWEEFDKNWILVPAHYVWKAEGYLFLAAYWDWPIEELGRAYYSIDIPNRTTGINYKPQSYITADQYLEQLSQEYPNYLYFFQQHYHFHRDFWDKSDLTPPWWAWPVWWGLNWNSQWSVWWWYTHPGFPQPAWINLELADAMPPPSSKLLAISSTLQPKPFIVTPQGVVSNEALRQAALTLNKGKFPGNKGALIFSSKNNQLQKIQEISQPKFSENDVLRPAGRVHEDQKTDPFPFPIDTKANKKNDPLKTPSATAPDKPDLSKLPKPRPSSQKIDSWYPFKRPDSLIEPPKKILETKKVIPEEQEKLEVPSESQKPAVKAIKPVYQQKIHQYQTYPNQSNQRIIIVPQNSNIRPPRPTWSQSQYWYHRQLQKQKDLWFRREQEKRRESQQKNSQRYPRNSNQPPPNQLQRYPANPIQNALEINGSDVNHPPHPNQIQKERPPD